MISVFCTHIKKLKIINIKYSEHLNFFLLSYFTKSFEIKFDDLIIYTHLNFRSGDVKSL